MHISFRYPRKLRYCRLIADHADTEHNSSGALPFERGPCLRVLELINTGSVACEYTVQTEHIHMAASHSRRFAGAGQTRAQFDSVAPGTQDYVPNAERR